MTIPEKIRQLDMYWGKQVARMSGAKGGQHTDEGHEAEDWEEAKTTAAVGCTEGAGSIHDFYPLSRPPLPIRSSAYTPMWRKPDFLGIPGAVYRRGGWPWLHSGLGSTSFPIPLQLSGAWDTALVYEVGRAIATETRAHGVDMLLAPVLCLPRDPRWGRVEETYGEDTYLDARNGVAMVRGLQGQVCQPPRCRDLRTQRTLRYMAYLRPEVIPRR